MTIISQNTEWTSGSTNVITSTLQVAAGTTLTIDPGAVVSGGTIQVFGTLDAPGLATNKITFKGVNLDEMSGGAMSINDAILQTAPFAIPPDIQANGTSFSLTNSNLQNVGVSIWSSGSATLTGNLFDGAGLTINAFTPITPPDTHGR
jgi:hypothetical protein